MKTLQLFSLLFLTNICFGQTNYYYQNDGKKLKTKTEVWSEYEVAKKTNSLLFNNRGTNEKSICELVIYHKEIKGDSIINYYKISYCSYEKEKPTQSDFIFRQDPMFLYLNKKLPDFKLKDIKGNEFSLHQLKGKPTLLNFTAIYCKACLEEIPRLNQLKKMYKDKVNFIAIFDVERNPGDVEKTINQNPFDFYILRNTAAFKTQLGLISLPYNVFVDKDGYVRDIQRKYHYETAENNYYTKILDKLIKKQ